MTDYLNTGFNRFFERKIKDEEETPLTIKKFKDPGDQFDTDFDDLTVRKLVQLWKKRDVLTPKHEQGKIYWDEATQKYKIAVGSNLWADVVYTTTSTSSTSTSTSTTA